MVTPQKIKHTPFTKGRWGVPTNLNLQCDMRMWYLIKMLNEHPPTSDQIYIHKYLIKTIFFEGAKEFAIFGLLDLANYLASSKKSKSLKPIVTKP